MLVMIINQLKIILVKYAIESMSLKMNYYKYIAVDEVSLSEMQTNNG